MNPKVLALLALLPIGSASAANYFLDFNSYPVDQPLDGYDNWEQRDASGNALLDDDSEYPASFTVGTSGGGAAIAIGGAYSSIPGGGDYVSVGRTFSSLPTGQKTISFQGMMVDSQTGEWAARDTFGFVVRNGAGDALLTISFVPVDPSPADPDSDDDALWTIHYAFGTDSLQATGDAIVELNPTDFAVNFGDDNTISFTYGASNATGSESGVAANYDPNSDVLRTEWFYSGGLGAGYYQIDNLAVVPEPSSMLLAGLGAIGLIARRRRH
jgi:hypothetical protein